MDNWITSGPDLIRTYFSSVKQPFTTDTQLTTTTTAQPTSPMKNSVSTARIA